MSAASPAIGVLLVDDHAVVREGYRRLLEREDNIRVTGEAGNAADAYQAFCRLAPDVVVMDISLPEASGISALQRMLGRAPDARVLIFSMHEEPIFPTRALRAGARGYITKASAPDVLVEAVKTVAQGGIYLSRDIAQSLALSRVDHANALSALSAREFEIVRLLAAGNSVSAIARMLGLGYKTVANYQSAIRQKLGVETPIQLVEIAARCGLTERGPAGTPPTAG